MKNSVFIVLLILFSSTIVRAQDEDHIVVPKSMLTQEQLDKATHSDVKKDVHEWVGLGREIGEAVNSSLSAITVQTNNFAQTGVGKLTVILVVWKVIGDQFVHILFGLLELIVFLPLWIWSYRRTCIDQRILIEKDKWQVVKYTPGDGDIHPRSVHFALILLLMGTILVTVFTA